MRKLLSLVATDRILLLSILGLAAAAHFLPVVAFHGDPRFVRWELAHEGLKYVAYEFPKRAISEQVDWGEWLDFISCLSNPLFWFGVMALVLSTRMSRRRAGVIAAFAGASALLCTLAFLPGQVDVTVHAGFYLWIASIFLLTFTGIWQAMRRPGRPGPRSGEMESPSPARPCG